MKKYTIYLLGFLSLMGLFYTTQTPYVLAKDVPSVMYQFLSELIGLGDVLYDEEAFTDPKNQKRIEKSLSRLEDLSQNLKKHKRLMTPGYNVSADYFIDRMHDSHQSYLEGHHRYAWRQFRTTLHACSHCHAQESTDKKIHWNFSTFEMPTAPFDRANFYYTVRGYDQSWDMFSDVVKTYKKEKLTDKQLAVSLDRLLTIALQMKRHPKQMLDFLETLSTTEKFPKYLQKQVQLWKVELQQLATLNQTQLLALPSSQFEAYIDNMYRDVYPFPKIGRAKEVVMTYGAGLISEYINTKPKQQTQRMVFWLGVSYLGLGDFEMSLLAEQYLQRCIEDYEATMVSHSCYHALKDHWMLDFSGSQGVNFPKDVESKLTTYRNKLNIPKTWPNLEF